MSVPPSRERDQFRRLVRMSFGRLLDAAIGSREIGAEHFVIWSAALMMTPPLFYTVLRTSAYPWIRFRSLELLQQVALADRLFFVLWSMLAAMLVVTVLWDALMPDLADQQVLGVLPVRTRTVAAARLFAAMSVGIVFAVAIALPTAVLYGISGAAHPVIGTIPSVFVGHLAATVLAAMFVYSALLVARGLLVTMFGAALAGKFALLMQFVSVLALFEVFMFLPGIVGGLVSDLLGGRERLAAWPPGWFIAVYAGLAGPKPELIGAAAGRAWRLTLLALLLAAAAYIVPARRNARRAIEARELSPRSSLVSGVIGLTALVLLRSEPSRALFRFTALSLMRNRRQLLRVATYLGFGVAIAGTRIISAIGRNRPVPFDAPHDFLIAIPLVLTFALVLGLRSAFAAPTDPAANWVFRLTSGRGATACASASAAVLVASGVVPLTAITAVTATALWGSATGVSLAVMHLASGVLLAVVVAHPIHFIPFTHLAAPNPAAVKVGLPIAMAGLHVFAFRLDDLQLLALGSPRGVLAYAAVALALAVAAGSARSRRGPTELSFEAPVDEAAQLRLSGSTG